MLVLLGCVMDTHSQGMDAWQFKSFSSCLLRQVKDKFCLDMNEEEAVQHFQSLIDESVRAVMAVFVEQIHKWAQVRGGGGGGCGERERGGGDWAGRKYREEGSGGTGMGGEGERVCGTT